MDLDTQFSDVKDVNYAIWKRFELQETVKTVWVEYCKKKDQIPGYIEIPEPKPWS